MSLIRTTKGNQMNTANLMTELNNLYCQTYGVKDRIKGTKKKAKPVQYNFLGAGCSMKVQYPDYSEKIKKSRVYVWVEDEGVLDNLNNRVNRPVALWKEIALKGLREIGLTEEFTGGLKWSQYAGCSCACSPGFIIKENVMGYDFHIKVSSDAPEAVVFDPDAPKRLTSV
jgi:hypothetical protein